MPAQFNINEITLNNPNRWFFVMNGAGEAGLVVFGYAGDQGATRVRTGQPTINAFLTEDELENFVNEDVGINEYYKNFKILILLDVLPFLSIKTSRFIKPASDKILSLLKTVL